jgi:hypothetical protein
MQPYSAALPLARRTLHTIDRSHSRADHDLLLNKSAPLARGARDKGGAPVLPLQPLQNLALELELDGATKIEITEAQIDLVDLRRSLLSLCFGPCCC